MDLGRHERWWRERGAAELRELLYAEWDPIGVKELAEASPAEYESYTGQIGRRLRAGATAEDLAALLHRLEVEEMGLERPEPPVDAARRIAEWYDASRASWAAARP